MSSHPFDISWRALWKIALFGLFAVLVFLGRDVVLCLFFALVISSGIDFIITFLERRGIPRTLGVVGVFALSAIALFIVAYVVFPIVIADAHQILSRFDRTTANYWLGPLLNFNGAASLGILVSRLSGRLVAGDGVELGTFSDFLRSAGLFIAVIVISFYLSLSRDGIDRFMRAVLPDSYQGAALRIYHRSRRKIGSWFRTQLLLSLVIGFLTWIALLALGAPHAFIIALLAGVLEIVPFVGPLLAGSVAIIAALTTSPTLALGTFIAFLVIHELEAHVFVPLLTRRSVGLHPVVVIVSLLVGFEAYGLLGALVAVPAAAVLQEVIDEWVLHRDAAAIPAPPAS